jgi:hypothetical protein
VVKGSRMLAPMLSAFHFLTHIAEGLFSRSPPYRRPVQQSMGLWLDTDLARWDRAPACRVVTGIDTTKV